MSQPLASLAVLRAKFRAVNRFIRYYEEAANLLEARMNMASALEPPLESNAMLREMTCVFQQNVRRPEPSISLILADLQYIATKIPKVRALRHEVRAMLAELVAKYRQIEPSLDRNSDEDQMLSRQVICSAVAVSVAEFRVLVDAGNALRNALAKNMETKREATDESNATTTPAGFRNDGNIRQWKDRLSADVQDTTVTLDGKVYDVKGDAPEFVLILLKANGNWVCTAEIVAAYPHLKGTRLDRLRAHLPSPIGALIESRSGKGYRLKMTPLE